MRHVHKVSARAQDPEGCDLSQVLVMICVNEHCDQQILGLQLCVKCSSMCSVLIYENVE